MTIETKPIYLELVKDLSKTSGTTLPATYSRKLTLAQDQTESGVLGVLLKFLKSYRAKFTRRFKVDQIVEVLEQVFKSAADDAKDVIKAILVEAIPDIVNQLGDKIDPLISEIAQETARVGSVKLDFNLISKKATEYFNDNATNYFTQFTDDQAKGIYDAISQAMESPDRYTLRDVVSNIRNSYAKDSLYFPTDTGVREIPVEQWASLTARTETARAASYAQQATLQSLNLQTWQWQSQGSCCDDCDENDDEIVTIGDAFPSGDDAPPAHPNCRCLCVAVMDELLSASDEPEENTD